MSENPVEYHVPGDHKTAIKEMVELTTTLHLLVAAKKLAALSGKTTDEIYEEIKTETNVLIDTLSQEQIYQLLDVISKDEFFLKNSGK